MCAGLLIVSTACKKDEDPVTVMVDTSMPQGTFTVSHSGTFVDQNSAGSAGTASLGTDSLGSQFLQFSSDFTTNLATGTVTVYLSTSDTYTADPGNGNPDLRIVGVTTTAGMQSFKLDPVAEAKFTHVILWCGSAGVPFGNAPLN